MSRKVFYVTPAADQLTDVLREIAEIEATPGFEGPKISAALTKEIQGRLKGFRRYPEIWYDHVVGEIGRACDAWGWLRTMSYDPKPADIHEVTIVVGNLIVTGRGETDALAAARAYRDALKSSIMSNV